MDGIWLTVSITLLQTYNLSLDGEVKSQHRTIVESLHVYTSVRGNTLATVIRILFNNLAPLGSFLAVVEPQIEVTFVLAKSREVKTVMSE